MPHQVSEVIDEAVRAFANEDPHRSCDVWYHGLPIWIVRERTDQRVDKVQVEAIVGNDSGPPKIWFTPDAYEDRISFDRSGNRRLDRVLASREEILAARTSWSVYDFARFHEAEGSKATRATVRGHIEKALQVAREMKLVESVSLEYSTPFAE